MQKRKTMVVLILILIFAVAGTLLYRSMVYPSREASPALESLGE